MTPQPIVRLSLLISVLSLLVTAASLTLKFFPESLAARFIAHPVDSVRVTSVCAGRSKGERVGDVFCGISEL